MSLALKAISILTSLYGFITFFPKLFILLNDEAYRAFTNLMQPLIEQSLRPLPLEFHIWHGLIGSFIWIIAGIALWKRLNWSRCLMAVWGLTVLLLTFSVYGVGGLFVWKSLIYLLLLALLFNPGNNQYFVKNTDD